MSRLRGFLCCLIGGVLILSTPLRAAESSYAEMYQAIYGRAPERVVSYISVSIQINQSKSSRMVIGSPNTDEPILIPGQLLLSLLKGKIVDTELEQVRQFVRPDGYISQDSLEGIPYKILYNRIENSVSFETPFNTRLASEISLAFTPFFNAISLEPMEFSVFSNINLRLSDAATGTANLVALSSPGRLAEVNLETLASYKSAVLRSVVTLIPQGMADALGSDRIQWGGLSLLFDSPEQSRLTFGSLEPDTTTIFRNPLLMGVMYQTTLVPLLQSDARSTFKFDHDLHQASKVQIWVNRQSIYESELQAGKFHFVDIPMNTGQNTILFVATSNAGLVEKRVFGWINSTYLLQPLMVRATAAAGIPVGLNPLTFWPQIPVVSLGGSMGLLDEVSVGGSVQLSANQAHLGGEWLVGHPLGLVRSGLDTSVTQAKGVGTWGAKAFVALEPYGSDKEDFVSSWRLEMNGLYGGYTPFSDFDLAQTNGAMSGHQLGLSAGVRLNIGPRSSMDFLGTAIVSSLPRLRSESLQMNVTKYWSDTFSTIGMIRSTSNANDPLHGKSSFVALIVNKIDFDWPVPTRVENKVTERSTSVLVSANVGPVTIQSEIGNNVILRSRIQANPAPFFVDVTLVPDINNSVADSSIGWRDSNGFVNYHYVNRINEESSGTNVYYSSDMGSVQGTFQNKFTKNISRRNQLLSLNVSTAIVFGDGKWGVARTVGNSFVLVIPNSRKSLDLRLMSGQKASMFGTIAVSSLTPYRATSIRLDASRLVMSGESIPPDYSVTPIYGKGYAIRVGKGNSTTLRGRVLGVGGDPMALTYLTIGDRVNAGEPTAIFTDHLGAFEVQGYLEGRYVLQFNDPQFKDVEFAVPKVTSDFHDLGTIRSRLTKAPAQVTPNALSVSVRTAAPSTRILPEDKVADVTANVNQKLADLYARNALKKVLPVTQVPTPNASLKTDDIGVALAKLPKWLMPAAMKWLEDGHIHLTDLHIWKSEVTRHQFAEFYVRTMKLHSSVSGRVSELPASVSLLQTHGVFIGVTVSDLTLPMTRAAVLSVLYKLSGEDARTVTPSGFDFRDVPPGHWVRLPLDWGVTKRVVAKKPYFRPSEKITTGELWEMMFQLRSDPLANQENRERIR